MEYTNTVPRYVMGFTIVLACFVLLFGLTQFEIPRANRDILFTALGLAFGWGTTVINFEFGSSRKAGTQPVTVENKPSDPIPVEAK